MSVKRINVQSQGIYRIRTVLKTSAQLSPASMVAVEAPGGVSRFRVRAVSSSGAVSPWATQKILVLQERLDSIIGYRVRAVASSGRLSPWVETAVMTGKDESSPGVDLIQASLAGVLRPRIVDDLIDIFVDLSARSPQRKLRGQDSLDYSVSAEISEPGISSITESTYYNAPFESAEEVVNVILSEVLEKYQSKIDLSDLFSFGLIEDAIAFNVLQAGPSAVSLAYEDALLSYARALLEAESKTKARDHISAVVSSGDERGGYIVERLDTAIKDLLSLVHVDVPLSSLAGATWSDDHVDTAMPGLREFICPQIHEEPSQHSEPVLSHKDDISRLIHDRAYPIAQAWTESLRDVSSADSSCYSPSATLKDLVLALLRQETWAVAQSEGQFSLYGVQDILADIEERKDISLDTVLAEKVRFGYSDAPTAAPIIPAADVLFLASLILEYATASVIPVVSGRDDISVRIGQAVTPRADVFKLSDVYDARIRQGFGATAGLEVNADEARIASDSLASALVLGEMEDRFSVKMVDFNVMAHTATDIGASKDAFIMGRFIMGVTPMGD